MSIQSTLKSNYPVNPYSEIKDAPEATSIKAPSRLNDFKTAAIAGTLLLAKGLECATAPAVFLAPIYTALYTIESVSPLLSKPFGAQPIGLGASLLVGSAAFSISAVTGLLTFAGGVKILKAVVAGREKIEKTSSLQAKKIAHVDRGVFGALIATSTLAGIGLITNKLFITKNFTNHALIAGVASGIFFTIGEMIEDRYKSQPEISDKSN